ncbi:MAG: hypothetical protein LBC04_02380 [Holosporaceae bacterium]|jgi:hypothetical protein|nr:hypothetical protein [Holosporaceae bacterium]
MAGIQFRFVVAFYRCEKYSNKVIYSFRLLRYVYNNKSGAICCEISFVEISQLKELAFQIREMVGKIDKKRLINGAEGSSNLF